MSAPAIRRVGIVGLGKMGRPMARHLLKRGFEVIATDVSAAACKEAQAEGVTIAPDAKGVAAGSDFVIVVVGFDAEVERVVSGADGIAAAARSGLFVGIASTVSPRTMKKIEARLGTTGAKVIDMPITRGEGAAEAGQLLVMVGGAEDAFAACKPALESFASSIFHVGDLGAGQVGKMVNNLILWACISANFEGLALAEKLDVDPERLRLALLESSAGNWALKNRIDEQPMPWAEKDMRIVLAEADRLRMSVPLCGVVTEVVKTVKYARGWPTPEVLES
jgi:3-hydroxyisobutyrate dehydrogenase-like beta-hydroxyacid dehydrogenase